MSQSLQAPSNVRFRAGTYFSWAGKLWYFVVDVEDDYEMAFVEDCKTEKQRWIKIELFEDEMEEVKLNTLC